MALARVLLRTAYSLELVAVRLLGPAHPAAVLVAGRLDSERPVVLEAARLPAR